MPSRQRGLLLTCLFLAGARVAPAAPADPARTRIAVEALSRLKGADLATNATLKAAVFRVLEATRGTPDFVRIIRAFNIQGEDSALLEIAAQNPADESGIDAAKLLLARPGPAPIVEALRSTNIQHATGVAEALGNTREKQVVALLAPLLTDPQRDVRVRKQVIRSLAAIQEGAAELLRLAREGGLSADVKLTASMELNHVRWANLKAEAAGLLPLPQSKNSGALPPVSALLKMSGDAKRGADVFARAEVGCAACHRVKDKGVDLGPALTEIGTKLGKDALYEAVLNPSAGVAFGYEAWQIELKNGDEAYGLVASETADELVLKDARNVPLRIKKADLVKRQQSKTSLMPADLQKTMSPQELVDLIEFLASLKKAAD